MKLFDWLKPKPLDWRALRVEPDGSHEFGPCECCGNMSRTVWGYVRAQTGTVAVYYVQWTRNSPQHGANFDLALGPWGDNAKSKDRQWVALLYHFRTGPGAFMVIDAATRLANLKPLAEKALRRDQVIGTQLAEHIFAIADAIFMGDERIQEIRDWSNGPA